MPRLCANLGFLYTERPFLERIGAAAADGFRGVEFPYPYDTPKERIAEELARFGLKQVLLNTPRGREPGNRGLACLPGREQEFQDAVGLCAEYCRALATSVVHVVAGVPPQGADRDACAATYTANMRFAARALAKVGTMALVEAINSKVDAPGFFIDRPSAAVAFVRDLGEPNLKVDFDFYHAQIMEGDLTRAFAAALPLVGHVQIADTPGRNEPGTGEIAYGFVLAELDRLGYAGWVGLEYHPKTTTAASLAWARPYLVG